MPEDVAYLNDYDIIEKWLKDCGKTDLMSSKEEKKMALEIDSQRKYLIGILCFFNTTHESIDKTIKNAKNRLDGKGMDVSSLEKYSRRLKMLRRYFPDRDVKHLDQKQSDQIQKAIKMICGENDGFYREIEIAHCFNKIEKIHREIEFNNLPNSKKVAFVHKTIKEKSGLKPKSWRTLYRVLKEEFEKHIELRNKFIEANLRLVVNIAKTYRNYSVSVKFSDLIQEGNRALIHALNRFDPNLGFKYSTYATYWVKQYINRYLDVRGQEVRIPCHQSAQIKKINKAKSELISSGKDLDYDAIAIKTKIKKKEIYNIERRSMLSFYSMNEYMEDNDCEFMDMFSDEKTPSPYEDNTEKESRVMLLSVIKNHLSKREQQILKMRYGFDEHGDTEIITLEEIGKQLGVTRERIRQLEIKCIKRLRHPAVNKKLRQCVA